MKTLVTAIVLVSVALTGYAQAQTWYELEENETYVSDFILAPGAEKEVSIDSANALTVGFRADVGGFDEYNDLQAKYGPDVIMLRNITADFNLMSVAGGSLEVQPTQGKLLVSVKNLTDREFKVVVYTEPITED
jgi:hypothetical protein